MDKLAIHGGPKAKSTPYTLTNKYGDAELEQLQKTRAAYAWISTWIGKWILHYLLLWGVAVAAALRFARVAHDPPCALRAQARAETGNRPISLRSCFR